MLSPTSLLDKIFQLIEGLDENKTIEPKNILDLNDATSYKALWEVLYKKECEDLFTLWIAAFIGEFDNFKIFITLFNRLKSKLTVQDLLAAAQRGTYQHQSIWWLVTRATIIGQLEAFEITLNHFKDQLTLEHIHAIAYQDHSIWSILAGAAADGYPQAFTTAFNHFKEQLTLEHLHATELEQDQSIWRLLAGAAVNGHPEVFLTAFNHFKQQLKLEHLNAITQEEEEPSTWYLLASAAINGHPAVFLAAFNQFKDQLTLEHLNETVKEGPNKDQSIWWLLAVARLHVGTQRHFSLPLTILNLN